MDERHDRLLPGRRDEFDLRRFLAAALITGVIGSIALSTAGAMSAAPQQNALAADHELLRLDHPHVVVLKGKRVLCLFDGPRLVRTYPVDVGVRPQGQKHVQGDGRTPAGRFRIVTRNPFSPYHRFLGLDYPDLHAARRGLAFGLISPGEASNIEQAHVARRRPDWRTALGGGVGIHGRRRGSDWTGGCIALHDAHVEELYDVLRIGDTVEILP